MLKSPNSDAKSSGIQYALKTVVVTEWCSSLWRRKVEKFPTVSVIYKPANSSSVTMMPNSSSRSSSLSPSSSTLKYLLLVQNHFLLLFPWHDIFLERRPCCWKRQLEEDKNNFVDCLWYLPHRVNYSRLHPQPHKRGWCWEGETWKLMLRDVRSNGKQEEWPEIKACQA